MTSKNRFVQSRRWPSFSRSARRRSLSAQTDVYDRVTHGYAVSEGGVKIHYASLGPKEAGTAPLVVMIHGFPDFWYSLA